MSHRNYNNDSGREWRRDDARGPYRDEFRTNRNQDFPRGGQPSYYNNEPHHTGYGQHDRRGGGHFAEESFPIRRSGGIDPTQSWGISNAVWGPGSMRRDQRQDYAPYPVHNNAGGSRGYNNDRRRDDGYVQSRGGGGGYDDRYQRRDDGQWRSGGGSGGRSVDNTTVEQRRVEISATSNALFLEEVNLPAEFAFRLDTNSDHQLLTNESTGFRHKSSFIPSFYRDNLLGATEEYIKKNNIRSYLEKKPEEEEIEEESEPVAPGTSTPKNGNGRDRTAPKSAEYISVARKLPARFRGEEVERDDKKVELTTDEKREQLNVATRKNPEDIGMWRDFVDFQDEDCVDLKKKAKVEKKVSILETALRSNPRSSELHLDRLDLMNDILKSSDVLDEWEKLLTANQDSEVIWIERFKYAATQLQLYTSSALNKEFEKGFQKLRTMLNPSYPFPHQKPIKLNLLLPDLLFALTLLLRNSGHSEKGVAICQAQLEFNFNFPEAEARKTKNDKSSWKSILKLFELFWGLETLRFGEPGCKLGWNQVLETNPDELGGKSEPIGEADSLVTEFEDEFFESLNSSELESSLTRGEWELARSSKWIKIESLRSKLYWTPWHSRTSDVDECEDSNRLVLPSEISPFLLYIPPESFSSPFEKEISSFRHTVNYLLLLSHDFLPRTHTLESILAPFSSIALSDSTIFLSELNYWEKLMDLYHTNPKGAHGLETIPEGFQLPEFTLASSSSIFLPGKKLNWDTSEYPEAVTAHEQKLLEGNQAKYHAHMRSVVTQSLEHLSPPLASLLVQMWFRFEQKSMYGRDEEHKEIMSQARNLMKHEKLRGSVEAYTEIGLMEYFGGKRKKAIGVLAKTLTSSCKILREEMGQTDLVTDDNSLSDFLETHWEVVSGVTKLYRLIAEFHLKEGRSLALSVLVALGNQFDTIPENISTATTATPEEPSQVPSKTAILKAKRFYESVMNYLVPPPPGKGGADEEGIIVIDEEEPGFEGLEKWGGSNCLEFYAQKSNLIVEWTLAYSLFSYLTEEVFEAPSEIYGRVMEKLETLEPLSRSNKYAPRTVCGHNIQEQLYIGWCKLGALHVTLHPMQNSKFRTVFGKALELYPSSPPLLLLYMNVESQCSVVGKLWRSMVNMVKDTSPKNICTLDWAPIFMCYGLAKQIEEIESDSVIALDEFGIGGPAVAPDTIFYKLDAIFSAAENNLLTQSCPLIWRLHLKHLAIRAKEGKDVRRAHGLFYEAIRRCPSSKAIYMDAIAYFPEMMTEIMELMAQKELVVRLPVEELDLVLPFHGKEEPPSSSSKRRKNRKGNKGKKKQKVESEEGGSGSEDEDVIEIFSD